MVSGCIKSLCAPEPIYIKDDQQALLVILLYLVVCPNPHEWISERCLSVISRLHSLAVGAVCGVDGDLVALVDEERNHDLGAGLKGAFL